MKIIATSGFTDYELIDSGDAKRLERFGKYIIARPDPQAIWQPKKDNSFWEKADAVFIQNGSKGEWLNKNKVPDKWLIHYKNLSFYCRLTPFKHTGVFPEQAINWDFIEEKIKGTEREINVLNLFGYTGI